MDSYEIFSQQRFMLPFESSFSPTAAQKWLAENWHTAFYYSTIYVVVIFGLRYALVNSHPFALKKPLLVWNVLLAVFSILAFIRTVPELYNSVMYGGIYHSVCDSKYLSNDKITSLWTFLFILSKLPEFGDTLFIVLRKQPLIFLHWYHHILTLLYCWFTLQERTANSRWFVVMNAFIHSFMYSYYALKVLRVPVPKFISVLITSGQIFQMAVGCWVNYRTWQFMSAGATCVITKINLIVSSLMYFSYFVLFVRFFYLSYLSNKQRKLKSK